MKNVIKVTMFMAIVTMVILVSRFFWQGQILGILSIFTTLSVVFIGIVIFLENRNPTQTLTWLVVLGSFPLLGFFFYLLFGRNYRKRRLFQKKAMLDEQTFLKIEGERTVDPDKLSLIGDEHQQLLFRLAQKIGKSPISFSTETQVLTNGTHKFTMLFEELKKAIHHIHLEYYIVRHDEVGQELKNILIDRAKNGVKVRFLYDGVGSWKLSREYIEEMRAAGIEAVPFSPVKAPFLNNKINFRNHRKIVVIDGSVGFVGGINVGDEYLGKNEYFGFWRDTHLLLRGEAVRTLQLIFLQDWYYMTGKTFLTQGYLSPQLMAEGNYGGTQLIAGGPDNEWEVIKNLFFSMIASAKESIWIASPYFVPDEDILTALKVASLSGIDVRIMVPSRPDKKLVFYASRSYFPLLLEAGAKIYEYEKGFLHSKIVIVDHKIASIGTANMDMRSFHLNFEVNAFLYGTKSTQTLVNDYLQDIVDSKQIQYAEFQKRSFGQRLFESTSRLLSPLL